MYKRISDELQLQERILEVLIGLANAIAVGTIKQDQIANVALIVQKVFTIAEIYYARIEDGKFRKSKSFVCPDYNGFYYPRVTGNISELPEAMEAISKGLCHVVDSEEFSPAEKIYYSKLGIKSTYMCPVIVDEKLMGVVGFNKLEPCVWSKSESSLCQIFSSLVSTAIKKSKLIRALEEARRESQNRCELVQNTVDMIDGYMWNKDKNERYKFCSPSWKSLFFQLNEEDSVVGKTSEECINEFIERTGKEHTYKHISKLTSDHCLKQGVTCYYVEAGYINGKRLILDIVKTPLFNPGGEFVGTVGVARDRSDAAGIIQIMLKEYIAAGVAENLNEANMDADRATAYWIKDKHKHNDLLDEYGILPR